MSMITGIPARLRKSIRAINEARRAARRRWRKLPVMRQLNDVECGAACLAMILNYWGRTCSVAECRQQFGIGRDGLTARAIAKAAREYGLRVKAYTVEPHYFKDLPLPLIAHWEFKHFVVVERWSAKGVRIIDPAAGRQKLTPEEFDAGFTGVVLTFEPGVHFEKRRSMESPSWVGYLKSMLGASGAKWMLTQILAASLVLQVFGLMLPILTKILIDYIIPYRVSNLINILGAGMVILVLAQLTVAYLRSRLLISLRGRLEWQVMRDFFEHLLSLPYSFFQQRTGGDILMRLGSNSFIRETLTNQTLSVFLDGSFVIGYLLILGSQSWPFMLLVLGLAAMQVLVLLGTRRRLRELMNSELAARSEEQGYLVEAVNGIATLKSLGAEDRVMDHWSNIFTRQLNVSLSRSQFSAVIEMVTGTLRVLSPMLLLWYGASEVLAGKMSLGTMLALNAMGVALLSPLTTLIASAQQFQLVGANLDRIMDVMQAEPEQRVGESVLSHRLEGRIELCGVYFQYSTDAPPVLQDISFTIEPGQKVAIVGPTGSGKSTLAMLLLGFFQPTRGEILYDDIPLPQLNYRDLRTQMGVVLQESFLFSGSVRQNIALSNPELQLEIVHGVATTAEMHDEIIQMPMGYETLVAEGGSTLSGGQRQRLALARALTQNPAVLLLDEATSHLDVRTEMIVDRNLSALSCTRVVIAHRLSTVRNADLILVLEDGRIVERGKHDELLAGQGRYATLVQGQMEEKQAISL